MMKGSRAKKAKTIEEGTLIVAVDSGIVSNHGYCTAVDGRSTKTFSFDNTREGLDTFWSMILASKTRFQCTEVIVGYEATGPYGEPLIHYLKQKPVPIVQVTPMHTKKVKEINDNSPLKTDRKDPRVIADVIRLGHAFCNSDSGEKKLSKWHLRSGKRKGQRRISKRGRSLLRKILYYAAVQTIRKNGIMYEYYQRLIGREMKRIMALVAVFRKLLRIIFAIVRDDSEFITNDESQRKEVTREAA